MHKALALSFALAAIAFANPVRLRCEYLENPLGIDSARPGLSWQSDVRERNWVQSAYEIRVATSVAGLARPDVWVSGKQISSESVDVAYAGPGLQSRQRYYWTVRVWDSHDKPSAWAQPAFWEMGLLEKGEWSAPWVMWRNPEDEADRAGIRWIWYPGEEPSSAQSGTIRTFSVSLNLQEIPRQAALFVLAKGDVRETVNGRDAGGKTRNWQTFDRREIRDLLRVGDNRVEIAVTAKMGTPALAALLKITRVDGTLLRIPTSHDWMSSKPGDIGPTGSPRPSQPARELEVDADMGPLRQPAALLRREFPVDRPLRRARIYATALGSYRLFLNGKRLRDDVLTPDFTDYRKRVLYQTYDVTALLTQGPNAVAAMLGDGWYASPLTWTGRRFFLPTRALRVQLEIDYADGSRQSVVTDPAWKAASSAIVDSSIYGGEVYDARLEQPGWDKPGFDDSRWTAAVPYDAPAMLVSAQMSAPVHVNQTLAPKTLKQDPHGAWIYDLGQNMVGWATLRVRGPAGAMVRMRFAEILNPDGSIYRENLRNADATDIYTLRGGPAEIFAPHFTFHGFRYVEVTGYPGKPALADLTGEVANSLSDNPQGRVETASDLVNRMWLIGTWGQRGNFVSVPTDCPQRDERLGWMGDAGVFWRTGTYNFDVAAFSRKWMRDVSDAQTPAGAFTNVSPNVLPESPEGAPGWGDAGVIVPYTSWLQYGDKGILEENWGAMQRWMGYIEDGNSGFLRRKRLGPNFADWLAPDPNSRGDLIATAYWAMLARMMSQMAHALGRDDEAKRYDVLYESIRTAFQREWVRNDGTVGTGTQTSYVVALQAGLVPDALRTAAADKLVDEIRAHQWHLTTGFLGTPHLLFVLTDTGHADLAYRLLLNETYPSWGYMLSKGATTWWERWNGDTGDPAMNSFNHYAFGSVVAWVYRDVAGIDAVPSAPGFHEILIHPRLDAGMPHARAEYDSVYGRIISDWSRQPGAPFQLRITIPPNTTSRVVLPDIPNGVVSLDGKAVETKLEREGNVLETGSGTWLISVAEDSKGR